jgi:hypothetical protein
LKKSAFITIAFSVALLFIGCAGTAKLKIEGNQSVGDDWECTVTPEGVVRVVSSKYHIYLPFPGMHGEFIFKFKAIAEGEAEICLTNHFRGTPRESIMYKAVVDRRKRLTLTVVMNENADAEDVILDKGQME